MGICKCSKKRVTNQFCFNHKVNVCEFCMVNSHPTCIVQPYLQWLEDSSFKAKCSFCQLNFSNEECVRLLCYHVFHWTCLNKFYSSLPINTAPAGYTCPDCNMSIFPSPNTPTHSPVFSALKKKLSTTEWARIGLGLPLSNPLVTNNNLANSDNQLNASTKSPEESKNSQQIENPINAIEQTFNEQKKNLNSNIFIHHQNYNFPNNYDSSGQFQQSNIPVNVSNYLNNNSNHTNFSSFNSSSRRVPMDTDYSSNKDRLILDIDDDKYRSRPPIDRLFRYFKFLNYKHYLSANQKFTIMVIGSVLAIVLIFYILIKVGRNSAENDLLLNPKYDPNMMNIQDNFQDVNN